MPDRPLEGRRIAVTRPRAQARPLADALEGLGAVVLVVPLIRVEPLPAPTIAGLGLGGFDWIVFTSANAVAALGDLLVAPFAARVAAVGPATAEAVRAADIEPAFVPERFAGEAIAAGLGELRGARVLLPQAESAAPETAATLRAHGAEVVEVAVYRTVPVEPSPPELTALRSADAVVLASGSAARSLAAQGGAGDALVACIGPKTADVARERGLEVDLVAREATTEGMIEALVSRFQET